jgi:hypothetical protein
MGTHYRKSNKLTLMAAKLKPWYTVVTPREDLREGKPLDAAEFAVHLDKVREGRAPKDYQDPKQFFEKTFLTGNMLDLASQVVKRLTGVQMETSAVFNLATQFGGGKTHSLTLLYHLCKHGPDSNKWPGVSQILKAAEQKAVPTGATSVFVGTEFDSLSGRGGDDGTPMRKTPWGEMAWQLGGRAAFDLVAKHDEQGVSPGGDVLEKVIPNKACLILMDELMNYISRNRKTGLSDQFYSFLQNLTETVRGKERCVLAVSIPASDMEMNAQDVEDYNRITKLLDRLGKAMVMSAETETSEIIRRRLFEWDLRAVGSNGKVMLDREATKTCEGYAQWCIDHKQQIPGWFSTDEAKKQFQDAYPFHPSVLSVFERKWRGIPKFQQTRGILRLLALWVSRAYKDGYNGAHRDALITLGTAPLEDSTFRSACFEQLGERNLETAITTDIAGSANAHAVRLDKEATDDIRKTRLHQKVATSIFFESNGGQTAKKSDGGATYRNASAPETRLTVGDPFIDIGNVETTLEALSAACYYLTIERNEYRFSLRENLNKRYADRRATIQSGAVKDRINREIQSVFGKSSAKISPIFFPEKSIQIPDRPALTVIVADYNLGVDDGNKSQAETFIDKLIRENGSSSRTFKSAQIWIVADSPRMLREEATRLLAWEEIDADAGQLNYDEGQVKQLNENIKRAKSDLKETIWRTYKYIYILGKDNKLQQVDMGLVNSSQTSGGPVDAVLGRLQGDDIICKGISPQFLIRNWPPAFNEWSTRNVRDAFFASPQFPRLLYPDSLKETIARGVSQGTIGYVVKRADGLYEPFNFEAPLNPFDVEISEDVCIITRETAINFRERIAAEAEGKNSTPTEEAGAEPARGKEGSSSTPGAKPDTGDASTGVQTPFQTDFFRKLSWTGEVAPHKWMNFYTKVLSKYAGDKNLNLKVSFDTSPESGITFERIAETKNALRELGLNSDDLKGEK